MTSLSIANGRRFDGMRDQVISAINKLSAERRSAVREGRLDEAKAAIGLRTQLRQELRRIEDAEEAFLKSSLSVAEAEKRLKVASAQARAAVAAMQNTASILKQAAEILTLLTRIALLF